MKTIGKLLKFSSASIFLTLTPFLARAGDRLFVANETVPYSVRILDTGSNTLVGTLPFTGFTPDGAGRYLAFAPDGRLWVGDARNNAIFEFNSALVFRRELHIPGMDKPHGMALGTNGTLFVVSFRNRRLFKIDLESGNVIWEIGLSDLEPNYVVIGHGGRPFVSGWGGARVEEFDPSDGHLICTYVSSSPGHYGGMAFRDANRFFASNLGGPDLPQIEEFDASRCGSGPLREVRTDYVADLEIGRDGYVYATEIYQADRIARLDQATLGFVSEVSQGDLPRGGNQDIAFSPCFDDDNDGRTTCAGDCNDSNAAVYPGAPEICDGTDNDCDGVIPSSEVDADGDGYRICGNDCDDADPAIHPGAAELPGNSRDENCDGSLGACDPTAALRNHGQFVRCVAHEVDVLVAAGAITEAEGDFLIQSAAQSSVGKR